jgi:hypothetical protein
MKINTEYPMKDPESITTSLIKKQTKQKVGYQIFMHKFSLAKY